MEKTTIYLTDDLRREIKEIAARRETSEALVIREALGTYIAQQEQPMAHSIGSLKQTAPRVNAADAKSWVRTQWEQQRHRSQQARTVDEGERPDADA